MSIIAANFMQNLDGFHGRDFRTVFGEKPFRLLFHDMTKLRIRLEHRDISVPISILLLGINQLLARKEFSKQMCFEILGRDWGYQFIARMLLECDDVCLMEGANKLELVRIPRNNQNRMPLRPPPNGSRAENPKPNGEKVAAPAYEVNASVYLRPAPTLDTEP